MDCVYNSFPSIKHTTPSGVDSSRKETSSDPLSPHPLVITLITGVCLSIPFRDIWSVYYFTILYHRTTCNWGVSMKFCHPLLGADPSSLRLYPSYSCCPSQNLRGIFLGFRKMSVFIVLSLTVTSRREHRPICGVIINWRRGCRPKASEACQELGSPSVTFG